MRAATGNQCTLMKRGVACALFGFLKTTLAVAFWIRCRGLTVHAGRPAKRAKMLEQEPGQGVIERA